MFYLIAFTRVTDNYAFDATHVDHLDWKKTM